MLLCSPSSKLLHNCYFLFPAVFQKKLVTADFVQSPILLELDVPRGLGMLEEHRAKELLVKELVSIPTSGLQKTPGKREVQSGEYFGEVSLEVISAGDGIQAWVMLCLTQLFFYSHLSTVIF